MKIVQAFPKTIASVKANYLAIFSATLIVLTILIVYWQDLSILTNEALQSESVSHILLVPFLITYLLYRKRNMVKASVSLKRLQEKTRYVSLDEIIGLALCLSAFLLYWYGSYTFYPVEYHLASLPLLVGGISLILLNRKTLTILIFPILFLLFLVPPPSTITYTTGALMANFNTQASYTILQTAGLPVTLSSAYGAPTIAINNINGQPISFTIDLACSGIYSLTAFTMFATFLAYIIRGSIFKKATLFALGFSILIVLNIVRISSIILIGYQFGEEIAMTLFHTFTGWLLIFTGILLLLFIAEKFLHLEIFSNLNKTPHCNKCKTTTNNHQNFCLNCGRFLNNQKLNISKRTLTKIAALLLGCYLVTLSIQAPVFAFAQGPAITSQNWQTSTTIFPEFSGYNLRFLYRDVAYEKISDQDASLLYAYIPLNASNSTIYILVGVADSITNLHNWEVCLVTWQTAHDKPPLVLVLDSRDIQILQNPSIIASYFVFQSPANYTQVTLYWYEQALFNTGTTIQQKYVRISLISLTTNQNNYQELENKLLTFGKSIATHWEPLKQQSLVSIGIPLQQSLLAGSIAFAVITGTAQYINEKRKKSNNLKIFENFATLDEKLVLQTIQKLGRETKAITLEAVQLALKKATDNTMKSEKVINILNNLENYGIIKKDIINVQNNPKLIWKF